MLQSILESSYHGLNRFQVYKEEKTLLDGRKGDPKKSEIFAIFFKHPLTPLILGRKNCNRAFWKALTMD